MVRFVDTPYVCEAVKPKMSAIKWKMLCGIGMTRLCFITLADNKNDLFDIYPAPVFKQKAMRRGDRVIIGVASNTDSAQELIMRMINDCLEAKGNLSDVRGYYEEYIREHL